MGALEYGNDADRLIRQVNRIDLRLRLLASEKERLEERRRLALERLRVCDGSEDRTDRGAE